MITSSEVDYSYFDLLIMLVLGHFLCDFGLQGERMAIEKCPGRDIIFNWRWWLISHSAIHGFFVSLITGIPILGVFELLFHSIIDLGKCRLRYSLLVDQILHLATKIFIVIIIELVN